MGRTLRAEKWENEADDKNKKMMRNKEMKEKEKKKRGL